MPSTMMLSIYILSIKKNLLYQIRTDSGGGIIVIMF